ncbi:molybdopterin-guanine dinucleotide biosynthesis protein B [candidate division KSB1 bacterium]|nr:molybdopterin-guanine dinucleotide biosynthesis protein B [candidate division KSB1 bacterium]
MKIVQVCGYSNSGKTTLIEALVRKLSPRFSISVIKSIHKPSFNIDEPGTDTFRFAQAGAVQVVASAPHQTTFIQQSGISIELLLSNITTAWTIIEGFAHESLPRIVCSKNKNEIEPFLTDKTLAISGIVASELVSFNQLPVFNNRNAKHIDELVTLLLNLQKKN